MGPGCRRLLLSAALVSPALQAEWQSEASFQISEGTDLLGRELGRLRAGDPQACCRRCASEPDCAVAVFHEHDCWLRKSVDAGVSREGFVACAPEVAEGRLLLTMGQPAPTNAGGPGELTWPLGQPPPSRSAAPGAGQPVATVTGTSASTTQTTSAPPVQASRDAARGRPLDGTCRCSAGTDLEGGDLATVSVLDIAECCYTCASNPECAVGVFIGSVCRLKGSSATGSARHGVAGHVACAPGNGSVLERSVAGALVESESHGALREDGARGGGHPTEWSLDPASCEALGCVGFDAGLPCQCSDGCLERSDCCFDFAAQCSPRSNQITATLDSSSSKCKMHFDVDFLGGSTEELRAVASPGACAAACQALAVCSHFSAEPAGAGVLCYLKGGVPARWVDSKGTIAGTCSDAESQPAHLRKKFETFPVDLLERPRSLVLLCSCASLAALAFGLAIKQSLRSCRRASPGVLQLYSEVGAGTPTSLDDVEADARTQLRSWTR